MNDTRKFKNFGGNLSWTPSHFYRPSTEDELLSLLSRHRGEKIRAVASGHSWSPVAVTPGVSIDLGLLNKVQLDASGDRCVARVGAGCTLNRLLKVLKDSPWTLPTLGAITSQTVAGAVSTGTHGSGAPGLSHWVVRARVARYDPHTGEPRIVEIAGGEELEAVRCALGCMGILVEVVLTCRKRYLVRESLHVHHSLEELQLAITDRPLSFFIMVPYAGTFVCWRREEAAWRDLTFLERWKARLYRVFKFVATDVTFHLMILALRKRGLKAHRRFFRAAPKLMMLERPVLDESEAQLTIAHDLFCHEEMEVFLPETELAGAVRLMSQVLESLAAGKDAADSEIESLLKEDGSWESLMELRGSYLHHYPLVFRKVPPEDTLISMAAGARTWYSVSFFTYSPDRTSFYEVCGWLAGVLHRCFGARLHWGKFFPLDHRQMETVYPELNRFREQCLANDPRGSFRNEFVDRVVGFSAHRGRDPEPGQESAN